MIYFFQADLLGRVKIGYSSRAGVEKRLAACQTGSPVTLRLILTIPGRRDRETELHERFKDYRLHGEWFQLGGRLSSFIARQQGRPCRVLPERQARANRSSSDWLIARFRERLEWTSEQLFNAARMSGISRRSIYDAKEALAVPKARKTIVDGRVCWVWVVPHDWQGFASGVPA